VQRMNAKKIVKLAKDLIIIGALSTHQDILTIRQHKRIIVFQIACESNKKILKQNDFWAKKISIIAILRQKCVNVIMNEIRVKDIFKNIKKEELKTLYNACARTYLSLKINKIQWFIKDNYKQEYVSIII